MYFRNVQRQKQFEKKASSDLNPKVIAAIYLLSADYKLYHKYKDRIKGNSIDLNAIDLSGLTPEGYFLYKAAEDIYKDTRNISLSDICVKQLAPKWLVEIICQAVWLSRDGILEITDKFKGLL